MALQFSYTEPDTQAPYPQAYARIDAIALDHLTTGGGTLSVGVYASSSTARAAPVKRLNIVLTDDEAATLRGQALQLLYNILKARPDFSGAVDV